MPRAPWRPLSVMIVVVSLAMSLVLVAPASVGASSSHASRHMPRLIGLSRARVFAVMHANALYFVTRGPGSSTGKWREVVGQSPKPGTLVPWHFQATLTTSLQSPHGPRRVPRLIGLSRARTFAVMERVQLFFTTRGPGSSDGRWVVVLHQTPPAGALVRWHAVVSLSVSTVRPRPKTTVHAPPKRHHPVKKRPPPTTTTTVHKVPATTTTTTTVPIPTTTYPGETTTTTIAPPPTTTTTVHKVPVTTTTIKKKKRKRTRAHDFRIGDATWYDYIPGRCATWYLPYGTRITVRDVATGKSVHCIVTDREAAHGNRVVDLSETQFAQLAPLARGVIVVKVSW